MAQPASGFYIRASSPQVAPRTAGYDYGAKWGIAPAGLTPASTAARLAALPPAGPIWRAHDRLSQTTQAAWEKSRKNIRKRWVRDRAGQRALAGAAWARARAKPGAGPPPEPGAPARRWGAA